MSLSGVRFRSKDTISDRLHLQGIEKLNSSCSFQTNAPRRLVPFAFDLSFLKNGRRLLLFVMCVNWFCAVSVSLALGFIDAGWINALLLTSFIALAYLPARKEGRQVRTARINKAHFLRDTELTQSSREGDTDGLFRRIFDNAAGMALVSPSGQWLTVNRALCELLGYSDDEELLAKSFNDISHPDDAAATCLQIEKLLAGRIPSYQSEQRFTHKLGHVVWMLVNVSMVRGSKDNLFYLVFQFQDITGRKTEEERLVHSVFHDALTGLPNRTLLMDRLRLATERARRRKDQVFAVLFLDLDGFKAINDSMGHIMGDQLLIEVARRLTACLRTTDTIARLGGDEFTILLEDLSDERESLRVVERLQKEFARSFRLTTRDILVTASIGVAFGSQAYQNPEEILRDADIAMYGAKSAGKARYHIFDREQHTPQRDVINLADDLENAIEREELVAYYQPIVCLETGKLTAFEALVRWRHPQRGLILPDDFIPLAEDTGLIVPIGAWILREACMQLKQWHEKFPFQASLAVAVNLSGKQFMQPNLIDEVIEILQQTGIDPRTLKLEITESVVMENIGAAPIVLQQLRALGIELSVDDFGTGYSSLSYLHRLPINSLKIDRSFIKGVVEKRDHAEIVKTILTLARSLGIRVVAEGVETLEQLIELRRLKCDAAQGYLFSKPGDAETAEILVESTKQWQRTIVSLESHNEKHNFEISHDGLATRAERRGLLRAV